MLLDIFHLHGKLRNHIDIFGYRAVDKYLHYNIVCYATLCYEFNLIFFLFVFMVDLRICDNIQ